MFGAVLASEGISEGPSVDSTSGPARLLVVDGVEGKEFVPEGGRLYCCDWGCVWGWCGW